MCYNFELSFNVRKHLDTSTFENKVIGMVTEHGGTYDIQYESHENKWKLHCCIITAQFEKTDGTNNCTSFIQKVKKTPQLHIESIYEEKSNKVDMLYTSKYYLHQLDYDSATKIKENKKNRSYSDDQIRIINALCNGVNNGVNNGSNRKRSKSLVISYDEYLKML